MGRGVVTGMGYKVWGTSCGASWWGVPMPSMSLSDPSPSDRAPNATAVPLQDTNTTLKSSALTGDTIQSLSEQRQANVRSEYK